MKRKKTLIAILLTVVMALSIVLPAAAGTIKITNYKSDSTYKAYLIFNVTYSGTNYSYTIDTASPWFDLVDDYDDLTLTQVGGSTTNYIVTQTSDFSAAEFAAYLGASIPTGAAAQTFTSDTLTVSLDGYYLVTAESTEKPLDEAVFTLTTNDPDVEIVDKNLYPDVDKVMDDADGIVEIGKTVTYTLTSLLPDTLEGYTAYTYALSDTMTSGLTFNKDVTVKLKKSGKSDTTYTPLTGELTYNTAGDGFVFSPALMASGAVKSTFADWLGGSFELTYTAVVNENSLTKASDNNSAYLEYSNDPSDTTSTDTTPEIELPVANCNIIVNKYDADDDSVKLKGAEFCLTNSAGKFYSYDAANKKIVWSTSQVNLTTDENGAINFKGLDKGTYNLTEVKAPAGYNKLDEPLTIVVDVDDDGAFIIGTGSSSSGITLSSYNYTASVANATGTELPATGAAGTTLLIALGAALFIGTGVILVTKKRMYNEG